MKASGGVVVGNQGFGGSPEGWPEATQEKDR